KRVYDDEAFYTSLRDQVNSGRALSPAQANALEKLAKKYKEHLDNFDDLGIEVVEQAPIDTQKVELALSLFAEVETWNEPRTVRGRTYDDKEFVTSIRSQYETLKTLSDRQVGALINTLGRYKTQIKDFETRTASLAVPEVKAGGRPAK